MTEPTIKTVNITPDVLKTPEGSARVTAALDRLDRARTSLAEAARDFLLARKTGNREEERDLIEDMTHAEREWRDATEHFLTVMSNRTEAAR